MDVVKNTKLIDQIFLLRTIANVKGYTFEANIKEKMVHIFNVLFKLFLLSNIIKQNVYPTKQFKKALNEVKNP